MVKILALSNHKGGVGKSCSTDNIGAGLNRKKKKVLLIDLDPQAVEVRNNYQKNFIKKVFPELREIA